MAFVDWFSSHIGKFIMTRSSPCIISGSGLFTPEEAINNEELVDSFNQAIDQKLPLEERAAAYSSSAFILKASGIENRHVLNKSGILDPNKMRPDLVEREDTDLSIQAEMAVKAAQQALDNANLQANQIDAIIVACSNLQRAYPAISIEVQAALGAQGFAYDMNVACSSATFGIANAVALIEANQAERILVINPEICSGHLDFTDRDCHFIFGDAATAVLIERKEQQQKGFDILSSHLETQFSNNIRNNAGFLNRTYPETANTRDKLFKQNGRKVFKDVCPMAAEHILNHLDKQDLKPESLKRLWLHQANLSMNELIAKKVMGRKPSIEEAPIILNEYANTSSAGSIIAFHLFQQNLNKDDLGLICSFGAGYSIGSITLKKI